MKGVFISKRKPDKRFGIGGRWFTHLSASLLSVLFVVGLQQFPLDSLNGLFVDAQFRLRVLKRPHPDIAIIQYDDRSSNRYYDSPFLPAEEIRLLMERLKDDFPFAVAFVGAIDEEKYIPSEMEQLQQSLSLVPQTMIGYIDDESYRKIQSNSLLGDFPTYPAYVSRDTFSYGADSVSRRAMVTISGVPTLYSELARIHKGTETIEFKHAHRFGEGGPMQVLINWQGPQGTYPTYSTESVVRGNVEPGTFRNKIVLIGTALSAKPQRDFILTPYSRRQTHTSVVEGAAHALGTLMKDSAVFHSPNWFNWTLNLLIGIVTVNIVLFFSPVVGILSVIAEVILLFVFAFLCLSIWHCWISFAHPFIIACFGYYLVIPYRLVNEYRQRWHYQQKTEMMSQLEQLKSNFLSLVSHDLKTPIARIQGHAEILQSEIEPKNERQKRAVAAIVQTTDNLSQHVETILDLTRIESSKIPLQRTSKDINSTILEVIESKKALAEEKSITVLTDLEPIFAFKFDMRLIKRVIANLLENAIKYSPPKSVIKLVSRESDDWIRVSVCDEGVGIPLEERERIFTKFYRCQNQATETEKGTGLGLYLVKYFVELHRGFVELDTKEGAGSVFTVALPV